MTTNARGHTAQVRRIWGDPLPTLNLDDVPPPCPSCKQQFATLRILVRHMKRKHPKRLLREAAAGRRWRTEQ